MSDLNAEIALWLSKAMTPNQVFAPKPMPVDLYDNNGAVRAARLLEGKAEALAAIHEGRAFDGREPFTDEDYVAFSAAHKDLAEGHRMLGEELKANRPDALQAISAHGDAMALHNDAARLAEMRLPSEELGERNLMWPNMESNQFRFGRKAPWDTEEKNWRKAHQAFIASQLAAQKTAFDTGVVEKGMDESLADILRHDEGHDRWHEMNGDAPCTSEADCAAKRAKYAEVKAEEAANVSKGDLPGHPFRGNQYTEASADLAQRVENVDGRKTWAATADQHKGFADEHRGIARQMMDAVNRGEISQERLPAVHEAVSDHFDAADLHDKAAKEAQDLTFMDNRKGDRGLDTAMDDYIPRAVDAENASGIAHDYTHMAFSLTPEELGKSAEIIQKGDVPGHVFHGNQYVDGTSSIPDNVGHRDFDPNTTLSQIGKMNILAVSGGKVNAIHNIDGAAVGVELPVSSGYKVRVFLRDDDTYTVQRVHKDSVKGEETGVFADQVGESVYQAGMYKSNPFGGHTPR